MLRAAYALAVLTVATATASAQSNAAPTAPSQQQPAQTAIGAAKNSQSLRQQVAANLKQSGFTDVKIVPNSFLVQAKDKSGNPVTMWLNPKSFTEVVAMSDEGQARGSTDRDEFVTLSSNNELSSKIVGTNVYNDANKDVGVIKDIAFGPSGVKAFIVDVGGFLGMGGHDVAVNPSAIKLSYDNSAKKWDARMQATAEQLKAAPEYKNLNGAG